MKYCINSIHDLFLPIERAERFAIVNLNRYTKIRINIRMLSISAHKKKTHIELSEKTITKNDRYKTFNR